MSVLMRQWLKLCVVFGAGGGIHYQRKVGTEAQEADLKMVPDADTQIIRPDLSAFRAPVQPV